MTHFSDRLPEEVEIGAVKRIDWETVVVTTDGGGEVRNNRRAYPVRTYECAFPHSESDGEVYQAVLDLYDKTEGLEHSFDLVDWTDRTGSTIVPVRFNSPLQITSPAGHLDHIDTLSLREVLPL